MTTSKVSAAAKQAKVPLVVVPSPSDFWARCKKTKPRLVVLDLETNGLDPIKLLGADKPDDVTPPQILAFGPHVQEKRLAAAREAGCDGVLARREFHGRMDQIFKSL